MATTISEAPQKEKLALKKAVERNDLNGLIVKQPKCAKMYFIDEGKRRLITNEILNLLFKPDVKIYEDLDVHLIQKGLPVPEESFLFRCEDSPKVFLRDKIKQSPHHPLVEVKRHIKNPMVMARYEFDWQKIHLFNVPLSAISWPDGPDISNPPEC